MWNQLPSSAKQVKVVNVMHPFLLVSSKLKCRSGTTTLIFWLYCFAFCQSVIATIISVISITV